MKRAISGAIVICLMLCLLPIACSSAANVPPFAYIDSITPTSITAGDAVTLNGHGTDTDGSVVAYSWSSSIDGAIGTTAFFTTSSLSAGTHTISFSVQDNNGAWSSTITAQLLVEAEADMEEAVDVVVEEILPDIPEIINGSPYMCLKLDSILRQGAIVEEDAPDSRLQLTLQEDMYFFYLDLAPGAFYAHPVYYILVDEDGNHEEHEAEWWPRIDDEVPGGLVRTIPDDNDVVAANVELMQPSAVQKVFDFPLLASLNCEGFIVVQGLMTGDDLYDCSVDDYMNRMEFFDAYRSSCSEVVGLAQSQALDVFDEIDRMVEANLNPITISIVAHGNVNYVVLGHQTVYASQFTAKVQEYPDTVFNFLITSCHSGSFIDDLGAQDNVCVVTAACRAWESAYPDWDAREGLTDHNPSDIGAEWTSSIIEEMSQIIENSENFDSISRMAEEHGVYETCVLICEGYYGALGIQTFGQNQDLDVCHRWGWETPQLYCAWEILE